MAEEASLGGLAVVGVDLQSRRHTDREALLCSMYSLPRRVTPGVANDLHRTSEQVHGVRNQHDVFVPTHQLTLSGGPSNYQSLQRHVERQAFALPSVLGLSTMKKRQATTFSLGLQVRRGRLRMYF